MRLVLVFVRSRMFVNIKTEVYHRYVNSWPDLCTVKSHHASGGGDRPRGAPPRSGSTDFPPMSPTFRSSGDGGTISPCGTNQESVCSDSEVPYVSYTGELKNHFTDVRRCWLCSSKFLRAVSQSSLFLGHKTYVLGYLYSELCKVKEVQQGWIYFHLSL